MTGADYYQSDAARRLLGDDPEQALRELREAVRNREWLEGAREALLAVADRHGAVAENVRDRVELCDDRSLLLAVMLRVADAADRATVERMIVDRLPWHDDDG